MPIGSPELPPEIVIVEVAVHGRTLAPHDSVILRAWQRCQDRPLDDVKRQFALNDFDIASDRFGRVCWQAEYVSGIGENAVGLPFEEPVRKRKCWRSLGSGAT